MFVGHAAVALAGKVRAPKLSLGVLWASGPFAPPPPSVRAVAVGSLAVWLLPVWAGWADRHRRVVREP